MQGLGEGGGDILNAAGNSLGNIFKSFLSPAFIVLQWILIILIIVYLLKIRGDRERTNVLMKTDRML